jgi:hypothetical protein
MCALSTILVLFSPVLSLEIYRIYSLVDKFLLDEACQSPLWFFNNSKSCATGYNRYRKTWNLWTLWTLLPTYMVVWWTIYHYMYGMDNSRAVPSNQ